LPDGLTPTERRLLAEAAVGGPTGERLMLVGSGQPESCTMNVGYARRGTESRQTGLGPDIAIGRICFNGLMAFPVIILWLRALGITHETTKKIGGPIEAGIDQESRGKIRLTTLGDHGVDPCLVGRVGSTAKRQRDWP